MAIIIRKALIRDVPDIHALINGCAKDGLLLPRSLNHLYTHMRDFFVAVDDDQLVGCASLSISWSDLAEICSTVVAASHRKMGIGGKLVNACLEEAVVLGVFRIFVLTYETKFFGSMEFVKVDKEVLPHKIWSVCYNCPKYPDCDETAMILEL